MAMMANLKIDVTKIDKKRLYRGKKGTYLNLTIAVADEPDEYGNNVTAWQEQTKEERENKEYRNFLGSSGKVFWSSDQSSPSRGNNHSEERGYDDDDDIPF